ncbi:solute carrier family 12 member 9-like isoform X1 [Anneissia japonica]|uniref:solute carrier family 12 member 9-like isoform X1 n=1 Tax=Anneissia japonica TaxID=1529436 RepID=UPI0014258CE8|nr:solute carrier family 12 member 9-like isoform X1 [Anneissia japonica]
MSANNVILSEADDVDEKSPLLRYHLLGKSMSVDAGRSNDRKLSTFFGVFLPCVLSMFSVILFLRIGFSVGQAGLVGTLIIFLIGYFIVFLTVLSICAISTNGAIEGGGAYFMISRALGPEFGGSIGVLFFAANVFSCALYCIGLTEAIIDNFGPNGSLVYGGMPSTRWWNFLYATIILFFCLIVCLIGATMFARTSFFIFLIVMVALGSVIISFFVTNPKNIPLTDRGNDSARYTGFSSETFDENLHANYTIDYTTGKQLSFAAVFAVIFNGCTGIMAGANMSGDLKQPSRSIPVGTIVACAFTFLTYVLLSFLVSATCSRELLLYSYGFMQKINFFPPLVVTGLIAATLSAALSTLIGGSRILSALAKDQIFGIILRPVQLGVSANDNPYVAVLVSWILVQCVLLMGELNAIAPIVSVLFMLVYACTNLACMALDIASAPNFRPTFKYFSWHTALLGFVGTVIMMFFINYVWALTSICVFAVLFLYIHFRVSGSSWGYISQALIFHQVRKYLLRLDIRKEHVKYWRPQMLLLVSNPRSSCKMIRFVNDMKKSGLYVIGHVKLGMMDEFPEDPVTREERQWLALIDCLHVKAFVELTLAETIREGAQHLMRIAGLGGMKVNTIVLGFYDDDVQEDHLTDGKFVQKLHLADSEENPQRFGYPLRREDDEKLLSAREYVMIISDAIRLRKSICVVRHINNFNRDELAHLTEKKTIDVWPINFFKPETAGYLDTACIFLLQLSCVLHMVPVWNKHTELRVFLCVDNKNVEAQTKMEKKLKSFLVDLRIKAKIHTISWDHVVSLNTYSETESDDGLPVTHVTDISTEYLNGINGLIKAEAENTVLTFCYLPLPPANATQHMQYLHLLNILTNGLPPTVLVHGISEVTSKDL